MMNFQRMMNEAIENITLQKLCSGLTILCVIIGVAAITAILAIGNSVRHFDYGGIDGILTNPRFIPFVGYARIAELLPFNNFIEANRSLQPHLITVGSASTSENVKTVFASGGMITSMDRITPEYLSTTKLAGSEGESITEPQLHGLASMVIFGSDVAGFLSDRTETSKGEYKIITIHSIVGNAFYIAGILTIFLGRVAGISLIVGGIGFINFLLIPITKRIRNIQQREAGDGRHSIIHSQSLMVPVSISLIGGFLGILAGRGLSYLLDTFVTKGSIVLNPIIDFNSILMIALFSAAVGIFVGLYPGNRATRQESLLSR